MSETKRKRKPPEYTQEQLDLAITLAAKGHSIKEICTQILSDEYEFWVYRQHDPLFANAYTCAREEGLEQIADGLLTAHDDYTDVQRARLKSDNAKWLLSKRKPTIYGDKVDIHVSQTIDIGQALKEARSRALSSALESNTDHVMLDVTPPKQIPE